MADMFTDPAANPDPIARGMNLAAGRLERYDVAFEMQAIQPTIELTLDVIKEAEGGKQALSQPGLELFTECVVIAAAMRARFDEPDLTYQDVQQYLAISSWFLNSFWHIDW